MPPRYSRADFRAALQALLPTGRIWPREEGTTQAQVLDGLAAVYERQSADAAALLSDAFPAGAHQLLPDWEATLAVSGETTLQRRRAAVVAQLIGVGGQSVPYLTAYAKALGFDVTITQYGPARAGGARAGSPCCGSDWSFCWRVGVSQWTMTKSRAGRSVAGEPLAAWGDDTLESALRRVAAAHTLALFAYTPPDAAPWDSGAVSWDHGSTIWEE
jgi:uncharacterized protein YmfQ (DUF2313 family)